MNYQYKVLQFQIAGGEDLNAGLTPLRRELLREEIQELRDAIKANDRIEVLDALCDIVYIACGTCNATGVKHNFSSCESLYDDPIYSDINKTVRSLHDYSSDIDYCISSVVSVCYELAYLFNFSLENFKEALDRVHESNMSKFCNTEQEAIDSVISYKDKGIEVYSKQNGDKWVIYRLSDNKILKSKYYHPVKLEDLI